MRRIHCNRSFENEIQEVDCFDADNIADAKAAVMHLIRQGHHRIAMANVLEDKDNPVDRLKGCSVVRFPLCSVQLIQ